MDTRMIDVAIGLVLAFALGSLLLTTFQEIVTTATNGRGRNLRAAIVSLLGDNAELADKLLKQPLLVSMAKEPAKDAPRDPSYLSADVFVTALLAMLAEGNGGKRAATPADLIRQLQAQVPAFDPKLLGSLSALAVGVEADWPGYQQRLTAWYDAVCERSIGWFKRSTQKQLYLYALLLAAAVNMNPLVIVDALWNDAALRKTTVAQAELALHTYQAGNGTPLAAALPVAATGADKPKGNDATRAVEDELAAINTRLSAADAVTGTGAEAAKKIRENFDASEALAQLPAVLDAERLQAGNDLSQQRQQAATRARLDALAAATGSKTLATLIAAERKERNKPAGVGKPKECKNPDDSAALQRLCDQLERMGAFQQTGLPLGWTWANWPAMFAVTCVNAPTTPGDKPSIDKCRSGNKLDDIKQGAWQNLPFALAGWAISALAMTLGAPFWFDLLAKLIKIRGSGAKPESADAPAPAGASGTLTPPSAVGKPAAALPAPAALQLPAPVSASLDAMSDAEKNLTREETLIIQRQLAMPMPYSGRIDLDTRNRITLWQTQRKTAATGILTAAEATALLNAASIEEDEAYAA
jgi:hypothetical protein